MGGGRCGLGSASPTSLLDKLSQEPRADKCLLCTRVAWWFNNEQSPEAQRLQISRILSEITWEAQWRLPFTNIGEIRLKNLVPSLIQRKASALPLVVRKHE